TTWGEALRAHGSQLASGVGAGLLAWFYVPAFFWWFTPVLAGLVLAVPVSVITSRSDLGLAASRAGLFLTPEEVAPSEVVQRYREIVGRRTGGAAGTRERPPWFSALVHPRVYAMHRR